MRGRTLKKPPRKKAPPKQPVDPRAKPAMWRAKKAVRQYGLGKLSLETALERVMAEGVPERSALAALQLQDEARAERAKKRKEKGRHDARS